MMSKVNNIAHRLVPLCLLLVALAGCRKEDTPAPDTPSGTPIAITPETATKAAVSGVEDIQNDANGFRVWSWFQGTTSGPMFGADGTPVTYDTATSAWTYSPTRYWMNGNYDFAAIYPAAITTGEGDAATTTAIAGTYAPATAGGTPVLTVPNFDATTQTDLLVAFNNGTDGTGINGATPPDAVDLTFQHALSCIQVRVKLNAEQFYTIERDQDGNQVLDENQNPVRVQNGYASVTKIGFRNVSTSGTLVASNTETRSIEWTPTESTGQIVLNYIEQPVEVTYLATDCLGNPGLFMIPQSVDNGKSELYMEVSIYFPRLMEEAIKKIYVIPLNIKESAVSEWETNKKYIYTGEITQEFAIDFSVTSVNAWENETLGGFIVS